MKISDSGISLLQEFEGLRLKPYKCSADVATIGYGSTAYADGSRVRMGDSAITVDEAKELFLITLEKYMRAVNKVCDANTTQNQFDAMVSLCYNIGTGAFGRSSVAAYHKAGDYQRAADSFWMWRKAGGRIIRGLVIRREKEKQHYMDESVTVKPEPRKPAPKKTTSKVKNGWFIDWSQWSPWKPKSKK